MKYFTGKKNMFFYITSRSVHWSRVVVATYVRWYVVVVVCWYQNRHKHAVTGKKHKKSGDSVIQWPYRLSQSDKIMHDDRGSKEKLYHRNI